MTLLILRGRADYWLVAPLLRSIACRFRRSTSHLSMWRGRGMEHLARLKLCATRSLAPKT